jgi:hypothetical protein
MPTTKPGGYSTILDVPLEPIAHAAPEATVRDCARLLDGGVGAVVVTSEPMRVVTVGAIVAVVATATPFSARLDELELETPVFVRDCTALEEAVHQLLRWPRRCVLVVDRQGGVRGRLTVPHALRALLAGPPWVEALQLALHIDSPGARGPSLPML